METKVKDLSVVEFQSLISDAFKDAMDDVIEDVLALTSNNHLKSIEEARSDYKEGKVKSLEEIFNV
ncbi:MAG: hypothetical protein P1P69_04410 [Methanosarcinaceae archaeon]|nr:hypothetical protein [Methanosarcinaceae archaeon]MDF1533730.1 hypothetical protein [Methanosarcinaceae archaeon]